MMRTRGSGSGRGPARIPETRSRFEAGRRGAPPVQPFPGRRARIQVGVEGGGVPARRRKATPIVAVSGPSGSGKTRLLSRLIPALARRGVRVAILKHTSHQHPFDRPGKDTAVLREAGALAALIQGPEGMALFGPPRRGARALAALLPPCDLVLAEGWRSDPLPRVEVHRRSVGREFLCQEDRRVFAVVTDEPPPRPVPAFGADDVEAVADLLVARFLAPRRRPGARAGRGATPRPGRSGPSRR
jgi:molybdopterin-guanine dinucleotide biosynthesis protein MobB